MNHNLFQWSPDLWLTLDQWGILIGLLTGVVNLLAVLIALIKRESIRRWFIRNRFPNVGEKTPLQKRDALIFTVSHSDVPLWMIKNTNPAYIALIASAQSYENALTIQHHAENKGIKVLPINTIEDADNPDETMQSCKQLIKQLQQYHCKQIALDITGGKIPMSMGAFMAAEEMQLDTLYVSTQYDQSLKKPDMRSAHAITISRPS